MLTILFAALAALIVLLGAQGLRMACDPQVGDLFDASEGSSEGEDERLGPFTRLTDLLGSFSQRLLLNAYGDRRVRRLAWQLRAAGRPVGLTAQSFIQREAGFVTVGLVLMLLSVLNGRIFYGIVLFVVFALWMHVWLWTAIRKRQEEIERDLPDFLDVFSVTVAAGLPFRVALRRVADEHAGPLAEEMSLTLREMQMGVTRRASLEGLRERTRSANVAAFVTALLQSEELGTPLEEALRQIAREVRRTRAQQVRRAATRAQPKVSLVVTMIIVPGVIILLGGSLIIMNLPALRGLFHA